MKPGRLIIFFLSTGILISLLYPFFGGDDEAAYKASIEKERKNRDQFMETAPDSPFGQGKKFRGLTYYTPDANFRIQADLQYEKSREVRSIQTSDGKSRSYLTYATASFDLGNLRHQLLIFENLDPGPERGNLFLAFTDETSGAETYGGGRYLDIRKVPGSTSVLLDFNMAYNPYCAYNENFSCPFPPAENHLKAAIIAGEKNYR
ncbi:MAG: DUF1684 domain-containing protein [Bacteroidetes bacterium]|nr:DUF1684 domain-containing protein [Bacteroidota bacterium]